MSGLPPLAVRPEEAARMLGISRDLFDKEVKPNVRHVRLGHGRRSVRLYPVAELEKWLDRNAGLPLGDDR